MILLDIQVCRLLRTSIWWHQDWYVYIASLCTSWHGPQIVFEKEIEAIFQIKTITSSISCFLIGCSSPIIPLHCGTLLVGRSKIHENGILVAPLDLPMLGIANGRVFSSFPCFSFYKDTHDRYSWGKILGMNHKLCCYVLLKEP